MTTENAVDCTLKDSTTHTASDPTQARKSGNAGAKIDLQATSIKYAINSLVSVEPTPNQSNTSNWNTRLAYGDRVGFGNPVISVEGIIDVEDSTPAEASHVDNEPVTVKILQKFMKCGHVFVFESIYDSTKSATPNAGYYRLHSLDGSEDATTINCVIGNLSIEFDTNVQEGQKLVYKIDLLEVRT